MSAVLALVETGGARVDVELAKALLARMRWRAPHGIAIWAEGPACLGRAAFEVCEDQDNETGPLSLGDLHCAGDVRLDDREALLADLKSRGVVAGPRTPDTQLLLHAWRHWGEACLQRIAGDFAFVLWDAATRCLIAAHDHYGVVPLFYGRTRTGLVVSNSLACLIGHPGLDLELDECAVADHLTFGMKLDGEGTFFRGIRRLRPGTWLEFRDGELRVRQYWQPESTEPEDLRWRGRACVDEFRELFDRAVADRFRARNASVHLSGGMDCSSIAVTLASLAGADTPSRLRAFNLEFAHLLPDDEGRLARQIARFSGLPLSVHAIDDALMRPPLPGDHVPPEPGRVGGNPPGQFMLADAARHGPVMFSGFGGDPLFGLAGGQTLTARRMMVRAVHKLAWGLRCRRPIDVLMTAPGRLANRARRLVRAPPPVVEEAPPWIDADFARRVHLTDRVHGWFDMTSRPTLTTMALAPMWSHLFREFDPDQTGHALRFVHPFFDRRLVRFVARMPPSPWRHRKLLLRLAMRGRLPSEILRRTKRGLSADPGTAVLNLHGPQPWMDALLDNAALPAWIHVDTARRQLHEPDARSRWTYHRLSFIWRLSWWLNTRDSGRVQAL